MSGFNGNFISRRSEQIHRDSIQCSYLGQFAPPKKQKANWPFCFFGTYVIAENRSSVRNRRSAAILRAVDESNGWISTHAMRVNTPSFAMPDSPRLHHKRTEILIESYRSFSLPQIPMIRAIFTFLRRKASACEVLSQRFARLYSCSKPNNPAGSELSLVLGLSLNCRFHQGQNAWMLCETHIEYPKDAILRLRVMRACLCEISL